MPEAGKKTHDNSHSPTPNFITWDALMAMTPNELRAQFPAAQRIIASGIRDGAVNLAREAEAQKRENTTNDE